MITIVRYNIYLGIDCICVVNMGTGIVEKVKKWGENFGYEIWEVEVETVEQYSWGSVGLPQGKL